MRDAVARLCEVLASMSVGVALIAAWTGGWHANLFGASISVRSLWRPLLLGAAMIAIRVWIAQRRSLAGDRAIDLGTRFASMTVIVCGVLAWITYLSPNVGGSDSYGYVSASDRLRAGRLIQPEPLADVLPFPEAIRAATPLGYTPAGRVPGASVPTFSLGLPIVMAVATSVAGKSGPFYVPLLAGVVVLLASFVIARRWFGDGSIALATVAALAFYPLLFFFVIQPMSDAVATAWFAMAVIGVMSRRASVACLGGVAAGMAFLTRTALLPGVTALTLVALVPRQSESDVKRSQRRPLGSWISRDRAAWRPAIAYALPLGAAVAFQGWLQWYLYGSPLANGYGSARELFSWAFMPINARIYGYWGALLHGPIWIVGFAAGLWLLRERHAWLVLAASAIAAVLPYAVYRPYDHWQTMRFLLPMLTLATIVAIAGLMLGNRRLFGETIGTVISLSLVAVLITTWVWWLNREQVTIMATGEERFRLAGEMVARVTSVDAVIITSLHSGSIRYYAGRDTIDWAGIPPGQFEPSARAVERHGRPVFLMFDRGEQSLFEARHGKAYATWLPAGQRRDIQLFEAPHESLRH